MARMSASDELHRTELAENALRNLRLLDEEIRANTSSLQPLILGICTQAEVFVDRIIGFLLDASVLWQDPLGSMLLTQVGNDYSKGWSSRNQYLRAFSLPIAGTAEGQAMATVIDLRNAMAHGDGRITNFQASKLTSQLDLEKRLARQLGVQTIARRTLPGPQTRSLALSITRKYIELLDSEFRKQHSTKYGL